MIDRIFVFGNINLENDSLPLRIMPQLQEKFPDTYNLVDRDFPFYQNSYRAKLDEETSEILKKDAKRLSEITGTEL